MKQEFCKKYLPEGNLQNAFLDFQRFTQGVWSMEECMDEQTIACYIKGLKHDIHNKVQLQPYITPNDVISSP